MNFYILGVLFSTLSLILATNVCRIKLNVFLFITISLLSYIGMILTLGTMLIVMSDDEPRDE